jgi:hypothetical protein
LSRIAMDGKISKYLLIEEMHLLHGVTGIFASAP